MKKLKIVNLTYFRPKRRGNIENTNNSLVNISLPPKPSDIRNFSENIRPHLLLKHLKWQHCPWMWQNCPVPMSHDQCKPLNIYLQVPWWRTPAKRIGELQITSSTAVCTDFACSQKIYFCQNFPRPETVSDGGTSLPSRNIQWRTQNIFMGAFIQRHMVVICIWCALFVTSQFDVIFMFTNQCLGEVCWHNMHILVRALPLIYVSLHWIQTISAPSYSRISEENKLNATTQQFITAEISGCALKQGSKTHSSLRQSNLQLQHEASLMSCRIRVVEHEKCAAGLAGAHPDL